MKKSIVVIICLVVVLCLGGCAAGGVALYKVYSGMVSEAENAQVVTDPDTFVKNLSEHISPSTFKGYTRVIVDDGVVYGLWIYEDGNPVYVDTTGNPTSSEKILLKVPSEYAGYIDSLIGTDDD